jgi:hypothetical protein
MTIPTEAARGKEKNMNSTRKPEKDGTIRWFPIRRGDGLVTGWIELMFSKYCGWVSMPNSRWKDTKDGTPREI